MIVEAAPVEETDPPELFDFIRARRASGKVEVLSFFDNCSTTAIVEKIIEKNPRG